MNFKYNISADVFDYLALTISISTVKCQNEFSAHCLIFLLIIYNNLSQQILSLHILHFITTHFTFYHCTNQLSLHTKFYILVVKAIFYLFATLIHKVFFALLEIIVHVLIRAALYPLWLCLIVSSVFQVPDAAMVEDSSNFRWPNETSSEASSSGNCFISFSSA